MGFPEIYCDNPELIVRQTPCGSSREIAQGQHASRSGKYFDWLFIVLELFIN